MIELRALHRTQASQQSARFPGIALFTSEGDVGEFLDGQAEFEPARGILAGEDLKIGIPHLTHQAGGSVLGGRGKGGEREQREGESGSKHFGFLRF